VLTDPGPLEYLRRYPVPVSLYSDIQREDFWQLGVRNFGHMLLSYRHLQVGVQINIKLLPKNGGGFRWVYGDPQRIGPYSRLTAPAIAMGRKLEELKAIDIGNLATLTPDELALLNFVKRLLLSSQVEGQLWTNSTAQRDTVQEIFKSIQQLGVQPQRKWQIFASIMNMIRQASENHDIMVASTSSLEAINGTSYTDRRKDLLAWNRGTRAFMQRMLEISRMSPDQSHTVLLNEDLHKLERCRMHLWYPDSPIKDVPDYVEIEQLMRARHANVQGISIQECRDLCQTIRSVPGCSMTVQCCAEIILAGTLIGEPQGWEDRLAELQNNKQLLNSLRWGSGNGWWPTLESWVDLAKQIIASMNAQTAKMEALT
jgi:hypothetical protein